MRRQFVYGMAAMLPFGIALFTKISCAPSRAVSLMATQPSVHSIKHLPSSYIRNQQLGQPTVQRQILHSNLPLVWQTPVIRPKHDANALALGLGTCVVSLAAAAISTLYRAVAKRPSIPLHMAMASVDGSDTHDQSPKKLVLQEAVVDGVEDVATTKWLTLQTISYTDRFGRKRKWNSVTRTTKTGRDADAVTVIPKLIKSGEEIKTIIVKQFRPSLGSRTVEFPAGLIDAGETPEVAGVRELYEETGYRGVAGVTFPMTALSPGLCNETVRIVCVTVDLDAAENAHPVAALDEGEDIEVEVVALSELVDRLQQLDHEGFVVFNGLYSFAVGMEINHPGWWV